jgi:hypothetical protein
MAYTTINKPSEYFNTKLYTGTGSTQSITGLDFQPDWCWLKSRGVANHRVFDAVRGATKGIYPSLDNPEGTTSEELNAFNSDGFTLGSETNVNANSVNFASWNWKANGAGVSNTDGSITSTVSANTTSGFSIVKYGNSTGVQTVGHGLGSDVKVLIIKNLTSANNWHVWHIGSPTGAIHLNEGAGATPSWFAAYQNSTAPTSSVFTVQSGSGDDTLGTSKDYIAYCFAEKKGFSKFGSYTGNGNANGTFVYTGFKPALLIRKRTDASNDWYINDNKRAGYNPQNDYLFPNTTQAESALQRFDFLSNGFKIRTTDGGDNASGGTYIYMAFAEQPLVGTNNIPATAR